MKRVSLVPNLKQWLETLGYQVVSIEGMHTSIDILAQSKGRKLAIKTIHNIDAINPKSAEDLYKIASLFDAKPVIIGVISKNGPLEKNIAYERFGVKCLSQETFRNSLSGIPPLIASKSVGVKISINGAKLRYLRRLNNLSVEILASELDVSKDTIYKHEKSGGYLAKGTLEKIETMLGGKVRAETEHDAINHLIKYTTFSGIKMRAIRVSSAPFNIIAKQKSYYEISDTNFNPRTLLKRACILKDLANSFERNYPFFVGESRSESLHGLAVISKNKLARMVSEEELIEEVEEGTNL